MAEARQQRTAFSRPRKATSTLRQLVSLGGLVGILALGSPLTGEDAGKVAEGRPKASSLTGQFLVATTELRDPRFTRTVIYMVRHSASGAMGLVVNRPMGEVPLADLLKRLGMETMGVAGDIRVHYGGPVEATRGFILHSTDYATEGTELVNDGIALTWQPEILRAIGAGTGPRRTLLVLGYAGWSPGQLEGEIGAGHWVTVPADEALVFDENYDRKWERAMARRIIDL